MEGEKEMSEEQKQKKRGGCLKWLVIILLVIIAFSACVASMSGSGEDNNASSSEDESTATSSESGEENSEEESNKEDIADIVEEETEVTEENLSVGDTVEMEGVTITINDAYYTDERNEFAEIEADSVLVLDVSFENSTGEDYSPAFDFSVYADGAKAEEYPVEDVILETVSDGRSGSGTIAYALVGEPSEIEVEYSPLLSFSGEKAIYTVNPE